MHELVPIPWLTRSMRGGMEPLTYVFTPFPLATAIVYIGKWTAELGDEVESRRESGTCLLTFLGLRFPAHFN